MLEAEELEYFLDSAVSHLVAAEDWTRLWRLLQSFDFLALRIRHGGFDALVDDFQSALGAWERASGTEAEITAGTEASPACATKPAEAPVPAIAADGGVHWTPPSTPFGQPLPTGKMVRGKVAETFRSLREGQGPRPFAHERSEADKVQDFATLVRTQRAALVYDPGEILSVALNASKWSACSLKAEAEAHALRQWFFRRRGRVPEISDAYVEIDPALAPGEPVRLFAASDSCGVVVVGSPRSVAVWNADNRVPLLRIPSATKISAIAISGDGKIVAIGLTNGGIAAWHVDRGVPLFDKAFLNDAVDALALAPDGNELFCAGSGRVIRIDVAAAEIAGEFIDDRLDNPSSLKVSPCSSLLFSGHGQGYLAVWDVSQEKCLTILSGGAASKRVVSIDCSDDGRYLVTGYLDDSVRIWDRWTRECLRKLMIGKGSGLNSVAMACDASLVAGCDKKQFVRIFDVDQGNFLKTLSAHQNVIAGARPSRTFDRLITAGAEGAVRVWTAGGLARHLIPPGHNGPVKALALSRDGKRLLSGGKDKTVRVWDAVSPKPLALLRGHTGPVLGVRWFGSGNCMSIGNDRRMRLWSLKHEGCTGIIEYDEWTGLYPFEAIYNDELRSIAMFRRGKLTIVNLTSGFELEIEHSFDAPPGFLGWIGDRLYFSNGDSGEVLVADGTSAVLAGSVEGRVTDVIAGPGGQGVLVATTKGAWRCDQPGRGGTMLSARPASIGLFLIDGEACIVSRDRTVEFVDLDTLSKRQIRTEDARHAHRGSLDTSIELFRYLPAERKCLSAHGRLLRLWDPQTGEVDASYFAESRIMSLTDGLVRGVLACGTGIGQLHILMLHGAGQEP